MIYTVKTLEKKKKNYVVTFSFNNDLIPLKISEELILDFRLVRGKILDEKQFNQLKNSINYDTYRQKLTFYTTYKPRTIHEARKYLEKYDIPDNISEKYIDKLLETHILNDEVYAKNYIDEYSSFRHMGPRKIVNDLCKKGIHPSIIESKIKNYTLALMKDNISYLIEKKLKASKNQSIIKAKESVISFLVNRGYEYSLVKEMIDIHRKSFKETIDEDKILMKEYKHYLKKYQRSDQKISLKEYILPKLMRKGYAYHKINQLIEGE